MQVFILFYFYLWDNVYIEKTNASQVANSILCPPPRSGDPNDMYFILFLNCTWDVRIDAYTQKVTTI